MVQIQTLLSFVNHSSASEVFLGISLPADKHQSKNPVEENETLNESTDPFSLKPTNRSAENSKKFSSSTTDASHPVTIILLLSKIYMLKWRHSLRLMSADLVGEVVIDGGPAAESILQM